jgi:C4-dicarboxylate-specific signal transduction histidine kinase
VALPLRRQIFAMNLAVLIPVFGAAAWSIDQTHDEQVAQLGEEARSIVGSIVVYLDRGLDIPAVQTVIGAIPLPPGAVITITDSRSRILARSSEAQQYVGHIVADGAVPPGDVPAINIRKGVDGVERVFANAVVHRGPWLVSAGIPTDVARNRVAPTARRNISIALGATWLTLVLEFLLFQPYKRAFDRATSFASRVASGDFSTPKTIRMPSRELEQLQTTLVTMVGKLRESTDALAAQVTEERRIRDELETLQQQVIRQERLAAIGALVSGVAHELNNPLQAILGSAELLQLRDDLPADTRADLALVQKEGARASAIIRNLSRFSRQQTHHPSAVRLREVVASVVELRKRKLEEHEIQLYVNCDGDPAVLAVYEELQQVVLNFMINAEQAVVEHAPPRRIAIDISNSGGRARLEVHDNGPGVPDDYEPRLFQPFFTTKPSGEGTGLGLSVSYGIVQSHSGIVGYRPSRLGGAMFFFEFPDVPELKNA